jgi:hypothetical protein
MRAPDKVFNSGDEESTVDYRLPYSLYVFMPYRLH